MNSSDRNKLIKAGFRVMRASKLNNTITENSSNGHWTLFGRYKNITALKAAVKELRGDEKTIFETEE